MNLSIDIVSETTTIAKTPSGAITGNLAFRIGSVFFPEPAWNDFIVVVLASWWNAIQELLSGSARKTELRFMDGPFYCRASIRGNMSELDLEFIDARNGDKVVQTAISGIEKLKELIRDASNNVLDEIRRQGWKSADINRLENAIGK